MFNLNFGLENQNFTQVRNIKQRSVQVIKNNKNRLIGQPRFFLCELNISKLLFDLSVKISNISNTPNISNI